MRRRGQVAVEALISLAGVAIVTAASTLLLAFAAVRTTRLASTSSLQLDAESVAADIERTVGLASRGTTGVGTLTLLIPHGKNSPSLGAQRFIYPAPANITNGREVYSTVSGTIVWYYLSDASGTFGTPGSVLWRAVRPSGTWEQSPPTPTLEERDLEWSWNPRTSRPRWPQVANMTLARFGYSTPTDSVWLRLDFRGRTDASLQDAPHPTAPDHRHATYTIQRFLGFPFY